MKRKIKIAIMTIGMTVLFSCGYDTHVINIVHEDGSVTRRVVMEGAEPDFDPDLYRVPVDSTWQIEISADTSGSSEQKWILTAEKYFANVEEINQAYQGDSGVNSGLERSAAFSKRFRWFTTTFRFSERVQPVLTVSCPMSEFLDEEELAFLYLPEKVRESLLNGPDSIYYGDLQENTDSIGEIWVWTSIVRQWTEIFYDRFGNDPGLQISREEMRSMEGALLEQIVRETNDEQAGTEEPVEMGGEEGDDELARILIPVAGKAFYQEFRSEIDSAGSVLEEMIEPFVATASYTIEIRMPGRIIASNGYAGTGQETGGGKYMLWSVSGEYFLTEPYEMWVESQVSNYWTWIVTGLFVLFVIAGLVVRRRKTSNLH
ncbi:MAG TPA: hypothetical protein ENO20_11865 [Bacteroides sp.]|nr:hypothetical protein [Bacteroides sp.]